MTRTFRQLDSRIEIVTPENIAFEYVLAGPFRRLPAYLVDCAICAIVLVAALVALSVSTAFAGATGVGIGLWLVCAFVLSWFYFGVFETFWNGQTPGKRLLGLRVLSVDGRPINALQAILRNVLRGADAFPVLEFGPSFGVPFYMVALLAMAITDRYQRLGDLACGTIVVVERRSKLQGLVAIADAEVVAFAAALPARFVPGRGAALALSIYVARRRLFTPARRFEIALPLAEPLCRRFGLPADTNPDLLLCALYYRTFIADRPAAGQIAGDPAPRRAEVAAR